MTLKPGESLRAVSSCRRMRNCPGHRTRPTRHRRGGRRGPLPATTPHDSQATSPGPAGEALANSAKKPGFATHNRGSTSRFDNNFGVLSAEACIFVSMCQSTGGRRQTEAIAGPTKEITLLPITSCLIPQRADDDLHPHSRHSNFAVELNHTIAARARVPTTRRAPAGTPACFVPNTCTTS